MIGIRPNRREFDSIGEFRAWLEATPPCWSLARQLSQRDVSVLGHGWFGGTDTYAQADALLVNGWHEGMRYLEDARRETAKFVAPIPLPERTLDVAGAYPMVPEFLAGNPAHMVSWSDDVRRTRPVVRVYMSMSISGAVQPDAIIARGAAILAWVDVLESAGYPCEIMLHDGSGSADNRDSYELLIMLKKAGDQLDVNKLAYPLMHPSMERRHNFAFCERLTGSIGESYGSAYDVATDETNVVHLGCMNFRDARWHNPVSAVALVREQILSGCGESVVLEDA